MPRPPVERRFDWRAAESCLAEIHKVAPQLLGQAVIIGGMACWFYRRLLTRAHDPDFEVPDFTLQEEALWLSKDIDFTNFFVEDARQVLRAFVVADSEGGAKIEVGGLPIGFAQIGVTLDPEQAWLDSWIGSFSTATGTVEFRVLDPVSLYREKQALSQKRGAASDRLHRALLEEYLRYELCQQVKTLKEVKNLEEKSAPLKFLSSIRDRAPEIAADHRVRQRIEIYLGTGSWTASERKLVSDIIEAAG